MTNTGLRGGKAGRGVCFGRTKTSRSSAERSPLSAVIHRELHDLRAVSARHLGPYSRFATQQTARYTSQTDLPKTLAPGRKGTSSRTAGPCPTIDQEAHWSYHTSDIWYAHPACEEICRWPGTESPSRFCLLCLHVLTSRQGAKTSLAVASAP